MKSHEWKTPVGVAVLALLGLLIALYGTATARHPPPDEAVPVLPLEPLQDAGAPSNEIKEFQQQG